ncbi:MAG: phosphodiesterase [Candidatus Competibacterales bacterium]
MIIAQLTDFHLVAPGERLQGRVDTNAMFTAAIEALNRLVPAPDVVLMTGDLTDHGTAAEYEVLRRALAAVQMPYYLIPGNHDDRAALRAAFQDQAYWPVTGPMCYVVDTHPVRLLALDTVVAGASHGLIDDGQLAWLAAQLAAAPGRPTVIFMHHPPFAVGTTMDRIGCVNGGALEKVIEGHPQVERVICGHCHRPIQRRWANTLVSIAPATGHQVALSLQGAGESLTLEPPAIQLLVWLAGERCLVNHTVYVDDFGGPGPVLGG